MLGSILSKETCAKCKFCCTFRRQSLWELPKVSEEFAGKHTEGFNGKPVKYAFDEKDGERYAVFDIAGGYVSGDPEEEVPCPFLDPDKGCILPDEDKPFDCKIWPLRYMEMQDGNAKVVVSDACPGIRAAGRAKVLETVNGGLGEKITDYFEDHPCFLNGYHEGYTEIR